MKLSERTLKLYYSGLSELSEDDNNIFQKLLFEIKEILSPYKVYKSDIPLNIKRILCDDSEATSLEFSECSLTQININEYKILYYQKSNIEKFSDFLLLEHNLGHDIYMLFSKYNIATSFNINHVLKDILNIPIKHCHGMRGK